MNRDYIIKLAREAGWPASVLRPPRPGVDTSEYLLVPTLERFAELIVLTCAEISHKHWEKYSGCSAHFSIREHFGVELREALGDKNE